jgi:hypothetical protein
MNLWDDDDSDNNAPTNTIQETGKRRTYDSDNESDKPNVLKRKDEKVLELIKEHAKKIKNCVENKLFDEILDIHEKLIKLYPQVQKVFSGKETPKIYSKSLYLIQKSIELPEDDQKKIPKKNYYIKLKKAIENQEEEIENVIEDYLIDKVSDDDLDLDEKVSDMSDGEDSMDVGKKDKEQIDEDEDQDDPAVRRKKWLKKEYREGYEEKTKATKDKDTKQNEIINPSNKDEYIKKILERIDRQGVQEKLNDEQIIKEYNEKVLLLGQKNKPPEMVERIEYLIISATDKGLKLKLYILIVSTYFELFQGNITELPISLWRKIYDHLLKMYTISEELYQISLDTAATNNTTEEKVRSRKNTWGNDDDDFGKDDFKGKRTDNNENVPLTLFKGSIVNFLEKLQQELYKSLQFNETSSSDFLEILKDEIKLISINLVYLNHSMFANVENSKIKSRISLVLIQHLYYRNSATIDLLLKNYRNLQESLNKNINNLKEINNSQGLLSFLFSMIYTKLDNKAKIKALLTEIYYYSINDRYTEAINLFNRSNLSQLVTMTKDNLTKVFYNRALIQLGLCAFRQGEFEVAKYYFSPLCCLGSSRLRDNLCQTNEKISNLDREEKKN